MSAGRTEPWVFPYPSTKWLQVYTMLPMDDPNLDLEALEALTNPAEVQSVVPTLEKLFASQPNQGDVRLIKSPHNHTVLR